MISTGDEEVDMQSIEVVAENIHTKAVQMHKEYQKHLEFNQKALKKEIKKSQEHEQQSYLLGQQTQIKKLLEQSGEDPPSKEKVVEFLKTIRIQFLAEVAKGRTPEEVGESFGKKVFSGGMMTM